MTPQQFLAEEKALRNEHEQEYSVFTEVPEMHPDYEAKYEQFITCYRKRTGGATSSDSQLEEQVWATYWIEELEKLKKDEWKEKRKELVEKYKQVFMEKRGKRLIPPVIPEIPKTETSDPSKALPINTAPLPSRSPSLPSPPSVTDSVLMQSLAFANNPNLKELKPLVKAKEVKKPQPAATRTNNSEDNFNVSKAFSSIEDICSFLGILGTALQGLLGLAREAGSITDNAMKIFTDPDNATLIKMSIEKCKSQLKSASPVDCMKLVKGISAAEQLVQRAKTQMKLPEPSKKDDDIDIELIAKATLGKKPTEILSFINSSLAFEGKSVSNDELTKIYLSVSALHMSMALEKTTPAAVSVPQHVSNNTPNPVSQTSTYSSPQAVTNTSFTSSNFIPLNLPSSSKNSILQASMAAASSPMPPYLLPSAQSNAIYSQPPPCLTSRPPPPVTHRPLPPVTNRPPPPEKTASVVSLPRVKEQVIRNSSTPPTSTASTKVDDSWFVQQVKSALSDPNITIEMFNKQLATIFAKKPRNYQFSSSDLNLASELQQLGTSSYTGDAFISTLKSLLNV